MHRSNFWDMMWKVDWQKDKKYIVLRVLQYGTQSDFDELKSRYSITDIINIVKENYFNLDDLTRNFFNIKFWLNLPLNKTLNEITSWYSLRFKEKIFVE